MHLRVDHFRFPQRHEILTFSIQAEHQGIYVNLWVFGHQYELSILKGKRGE